jgi:DNA-binding NtrC family response regulator/pSer/pThr/pTyr-binding forkhead associated (FHA) protein
MAAPTLHLSNTRGGGPTGTVEGPLHLTVMGPNVFANVPLPDTGVLTVGRDETADVRIVDESASRQHARLHIEAGPKLFIEDLDTKNGTFLHDNRLLPKKRETLQLGEAVTIGYTILVVQRRKPATQPRRLHSHASFEERLEEACQRAANAGGALALARLKLDGEEEGSQAADLLGGNLRPGDFLAQYAPGDYEVLLLDTAPERAQEIVTALAKRLRSNGLEAETALATFPGDGRTAEALIAHANGLLRGTDQAAPGEPVIKSEPVKRLYKLAERAAAGQGSTGLVNILILGENGVGKDVLAGWIHRHSPRAKGPYICINCGALSETLLESELFGYEKGAFTGATQAKAGLLEAAAGGTVFLDEIGEMSPALQTRLLRTLENKEITRVGAVKSRPIDVRFIAATNRDLEAAIVDRTFRQDLYFRLHQFALTVPPLRERLDEVEALAKHFLAEAARAGGSRRRVPRLSAQALEIMRGYTWPGNTRELRNTIDHALVLCEGDEITAEHLPVEKMRSTRLVESYPMGLGASHARDEDSSSDSNPGRQLTPEQQADKKRIMQVMADCAGSQTAAAKKLGISRGTLIERLKLYGIRRPRAS